MPIRGARLYTFSPRGIADSFDEADAFPGACRLLTNLMFDTANPNQVVARPGVGLPLTSFAGFTTPSYVSVHIVIGNYAYGMVSSAKNPGYDEPFAFNLLSNTFTAITGVTSGNVPSSPVTTGAWTPPVIAAVGKKLIVAHAGFSGAGSNFFGVLDITNVNAPTWTSANTATNPLPSVPTAVANYNNRAYFACGNTLVLSDVLTPTTVTNASQALTIGDSTSIVALNGLPIQTTSSGVAAALLVFKANQIWQIQGDPATSNLTENFVSLTVGTPSARSVVQTPIGVIFAGQDAPYVVANSGAVMELRNPSSPAADLRIPFQNSQTPSRASAAYAGSIYRICLATVIDGTTQTNDYWFDFRRMRWSGPHSFTYDCASQYNEMFILSGPLTAAALFVSATSDSTLNTVYNDNGSALASHMLTANFHDGDDMNYKQTVESSIDVSSGGISAAFTLQMLDEESSVLSKATITTPSPPNVWGSFSWGDGTLYNAFSTRPDRYDVPWLNPIVWDRMGLDIQVTSSSAVTIGKLKMHTQSCGYSLHAPALGTILAPATPPAGNRLDINFILDQSTLS